MKPSPQTQVKMVLDLASARKLIRAKDVASLGLPTIILTRLVAAGKLERVGRGVYGLADASVDQHRSLAEVAIRVPIGVICLLSALRYHEIGTQSPFDVWMAIPLNAPTPRIDQPATRFLRMSQASLETGVNHTLIDGVDVAIFSIEKTIADCFKYRNKIGLDVAIEALSDAWQQKRVTIEQIMKYAATNRVTHVMRPYLEALTV
jgi:predicted transcriptional regulator of viral defense system